MMLIVEDFDWLWLYSGSAATVILVPGEAFPGEAVLEACTAAAETAGSGACVVAAAAGQLPGWKHPNPFTVVAEDAVRSGTTSAVAGATEAQPIFGVMLGPPGRQDSSPGY